MRNQVLTGVVLSILFSSCIGTRFLKEGQAVLYSQSVKGANGLSIDQIESLYENTPNKRLPIVPVAPYVYIYQRGLKKYDTAKYIAKKERIRAKYSAKLEKANGKAKKVAKIRSKMNRKLGKQDKNIKEGNLGMRIGEPLAIFDTAKESITTENLKAYLNSIGYFNSEVTYKHDTIHKNEIKVTYIIDRKKKYIMDSIYFVIPDQTVKDFLLSRWDDTQLVKDTYYEQKKLIQERDRITDLMLNNGYYEFNKQLVSFEVDTTFVDDHRVVVGVLVKNPPGKGSHRVFTLDSVIFTSDADIKGIRAKRNQEIYNRINYQYYRKRYSKKLMDWRLFIYPDSLYSKANTLETQRQFSNLDIFKFINVSYDTLGGKFVANIFTSPLKKYQTSTEAGVNVSQGLPGPFFNFNLKNRNTFKGLEVMELNGRVGFEGLGGVSEQGNGYSSLEYGGNLTFTFPQFLFPFGKTFKSKIGRFNPQTRLTFGLTYTDRLEYLRTNINSSLSYNWQKRQSRIYNLTVADISYIDSDITDEGFLNTLLQFQAQGNNLINSFRNSFVSSTTFSVINNYNNYGTKDQKSSFLRYSIEAGGNLLDVLGNTFLEDNIETFQFIKLRSDFRATRPINRKESLAYRFHVGYALPYGDNETLPYEKFFFAGGSNSIRAWEPRRLGPGSYNPLDSLGNYSNNFEQPGEIIFETSLEYRHKIFGFVYGAIFIDAGNVWTIRADGARPGADFAFNRFYKEIAVGTGYGLRFDFNFLLMRFDAGVKIYDPAGPPGTRFIGDSGFRDPAYENYRRYVFNIGIGYPF